MRKFVNGKYMDMTEEEIFALAEEKEHSIPSAEERIEALEMAMLEMLEVMANG